jgi:hypothetical protein
MRHVQVVFPRGDVTEPWPGLTYLVKFSRLHQRSVFCRGRSSDTYAGRLSSRKLRGNEEAPNGHAPFCRSLSSFVAAANLQHLPPTIMEATAQPHDPCNRDFLR